MEPGNSVTREVGPLDHALDGLVTAVDHLVKTVDDGGLDGYDDARLLGFLQDFERVRNRLPVVDHRVIVDAELRGLPAAVTQPSMGRLLVHLLRLAPAEAARRVAAAHACQQRTTMLGEVLAPCRPVLAAAQRDGAVSPDQVDIIVRALDRVSGGGFDPVDVDAGERLLTDFASTFACPDLKRLADQTVGAIDTDGTVPDAQLQQDRRHLSLRPCRDGKYAGEFRLTGPAGAKLTALLQPLTRPRLDPSAAGATTPPELVEGPSTSSGSVDGRTYGQRSHDALEELCDRLLRAGGSAATGGTPATVIVTITAENLIDRLGYGTTTDGTLLTAADVVALAAEADIIPIVLNHTGAVLTAGRTRRIATTAQTHALIARDGGCSSPAATEHRNGANGTTSPPGSTAAPPTSTTSPSSAPTTTTTSPKAAGPAPSTQTACPNGPHPAGSTATRHPDSTTASPPGSTCADNNGRPAGAPSPGGDGRRRPRENHRNPIRPCRYRHRAPRRSTPFPSRPHRHSHDHDAGSRAADPTPHT